MQVQLLDPPLRWHVVGDSGKPPYLVDMFEYDGNGRCDCAHFRCVLTALLDAGKRGESYQCKHIRLVMKELAKHAVRHFIAEEKARKQMKINYE
jgi:hypothetical protein